MTRALVIGAGVIGAATAHRLAEAGVDVTVLDAGGRTPGTSSATFSIDVTHLKTPHSYFLLNQRSAALHRELEREIRARTGAPGWRHPAPLVQWGHTEEEQRTLRARAERLADWGHPCRTADPGELRTLAPAVDPASCRATELVVHDDATWYDAPLLAHTLLDRAAALGADIRYDTPVTALLRDGERVRGAEARGRPFEADHVVNCAGPDAGRIAELAGVRLPLRRIPGLVGESVPLAEPLRAIVATPGVDLRPAPGNRVCAISWPVDALLAPTPDTQVPPEADLLGRCAAVLPAFRALGGTRIGVRPVPEDGLPLVGPHPRAPGLYTIATHSGVTLAPLLAALAAEELTTASPAPALAPYRPDRDTSRPIRDESLAVMSGHRAEAG
ncbi:NAD(P)/FAD-dependent oxidoreductase [Streptomyces botrytidirepellens]|uniref:FAD-binding oxidoreductase n=1 Tax=Streptomyces botrytidirepellens TaxID=2486417 RepID=A0A3M8VMT6_9ACTN|nr:FAD-dependent oxidoreductase [Streptomyces botrytidirepellens]RNG18337.1 FAD-binding oxidoreductase [Streptomyces botrytidirepellens]